jgi:Tol biopolymer transport system component
MRLPSPDGRWTAILDLQAGSLEVEDSQGNQQAVFPSGSAASAVEWSPDSQQLAVVLEPSPAGDETSNGKAPPELHLRRLKEGIFQPVEPFYRPDGSTDALSAPEQLRLGAWSPDSRRILFWLGPLSASLQADGLPLLALDSETMQPTHLAKAALLNPAYQSWAPDGQSLVFTSGGYRSAQVKKWLSLYTVGTGQVTTLIPEKEQVPGAVAWSPAGDRIAYAAVEASQTGADWADWVSWENPAIRARRIYLLDPHSNHPQRLNAVEAYQDAPHWGAGGKTLYYVQVDGDKATLMSADPQTGQAQPLPDCQAALPETAGFYGQVDWEALYAACPATGLPAN